MNNLCNRKFAQNPFLFQAPGIPFVTIQVTWSLGDAVRAAWYKKTFYNHDFGQTALQAEYFAAIGYGGYGSGSTRGTGALLDDCSHCKIIPGFSATALSFSFKWNGNRF